MFEPFPANDPIQITAAGLTVTLDPLSLLYRIDTPERSWQQAAAYAPQIRLKEGGTLLFSQAGSIRHCRYDSGVGTGILSFYDGFSLPDGPLSFSFETLVWIEYATGWVRFELIPGTEDALFSSVRWPAPFSFATARFDDVTVMPVMQGLLIPNTWENEVRTLPFDGQFGSAAAYMPWFGQIEGRHGYLAVCEEPWDAGYFVDHPAGGPGTHVGIYFLPSLGHLSYRRCVHFQFFASCDYNDLCKAYRAYVKETGLFTTLAEKSARSPLIDRLIGSAIVHKGIKTHVSPDSFYYDKEHPQKNDLVIPFSARAREIRRYHEKGIRKLYLHLDGWGDPGYDNRHPDYLPACEEAGGWPAMKELSDTLKDCGYLFGLHDQYRDYYMDAPSYDPEFACRSVDGSIPEMARWAGGRQSFLCATQAPYYVRRNFEEVLRHGIRLDASYLDVFTCNEGDECANPRHRMSRRECFRRREACFSYLWSKGILPSSEECGDWAMRQLVFCHYGPYDFMLAKPGSPRRGIPVPLFNLVYHDCLILPWPMDRLPDTEDYMLYALLNGGAAYVDKDGAYPDCDGAFDEAAEKRLDEEIARYQVVAALQERIAKCEMVRHELLDPRGRRQKSTFSDGTVVTIDLDQGSYEIRPE